MSGEDIALGDLVCAFRLELRDGMMRIDQLGQTLRTFEGEASTRLQGVGDAGEREGNRLADGISGGLSRAGQSLTNFLLGLVGVGGVLEGLRRLGAAFIAQNADADTFINRLTGVTGSAAAAREEFQRLGDLGLTWGVQVNDLVDTYIKLSQRGIEPTTANLKALGNVAAATGMQMGDIATAVANATMDSGRWLLTLGIQMKITGDKIAFDWADASGRMQRVTVANLDSMVQSTLYAIFNEKYPGRMEEAATSWRGLTTTLGNIWGDFLKKIGDAGAWTAAKTQLAGFAAAAKAALADSGTTEATRTWSNILTEIAKVVGTIMLGLIELPKALQSDSMLLGTILANIAVTIERIVLAGIQGFNQLAKAMAFLPGVTVNQQAYNDAIAIMRDTIAGTVAQGELYRQKGAAIAAEVTEMSRRFRDAAGGVGEFRVELVASHAPFEDISKIIAQSNKDLKDHADSLMAAKGVYTAAALDQEIGKVVKEMLDLHEAGVPSVEILEAYSPALKKLADRSADFEPGKLKMADTLRQWGFAAGSGKLAFDDMFTSIDRDWAGIIKGKMDPAVVTMKTSAGDIVTALSGGFGAGFDAAFTAGEAKFRRFVAKLGNEKITINVDINDADLAAKLMRLGYTPAGMDNTGGRTRPS